MAARTQQDGAHQLLSMIRTAYEDGQPAAEALGRKRGHARAVAQMCDLLDAATAL